MLQCCMLHAQKYDLIILTPKHNVSHPTLGYECHKKFQDKVQSKIGKFYSWENCFNHCGFSNFDDLQPVDFGIR